MADEQTPYQQDMKNRILQMELDNAELQQFYVKKRLEAVELTLEFEKTRLADYREYQASHALNNREEQEIRAQERRLRSIRVRKGLEVLNRER
jgi:hypothetical protein